ncbi:AraC family transcriptional regulator [Curvibacter sp. RS43]|uniref:helix-turn-helix domain-containing protein n=1 Tax=Curvibacter microcysteis TaxID=3026419 RepID=UPI00235E5271|nr:AraC family transcriptional regulator [Curvibacter sp. RS43]MDD0809591.1 AraC family transcriptional regulator [Curvibacter sp. RS43]
MDWRQGNRGEASLENTLQLKDAIHAHAPGSVNRVMSSLTDPVLLSHRYSPAHELLSPASDHLSITQALHYQATQVMGQLGDGWRDHFCPEPQAIHLLPPNTASEWRINGPSLVLRLSIPMSLVRSTWEELDLGPSPLTRIGSLAQAGFSEPFIYDALKRLWSMVRAQAECPPLLLQSYLVCILHKLAIRGQNSRPTSPERLHRPQIARVLEAIEDQLHEALSITDLARLAGVTSFHFIRLFRQALGRTPYQYIQQRRLDKARLMLATSTLPVADIGAAVGFADAAQFSRAFAKHIGMSPTQYRQQER